MIDNVNKKDENFWKALDTLAAESTVIIDRPKDSVHPRFANLIYPLDYGYLQGTVSMDGEGIDIWLGSREDRQLDAVICIVDLAKRETEIKLLIGCTDEEKEIVYKFHNQTELMKGILIHREENLPPVANASQNIIIKILTPGLPLWEQTADYALNCSWQGGDYLADDMRSGRISGWERVICAYSGGEIAGYAAVTKSDCINTVDYTPYISYVFVDEKNRGHRLSGRLIESACAYLKEQGFHEVYLVSNHENLYEKYGFSVIDRQPAYWGEMENIFQRML